MNSNPVVDNNGHVNDLVQKLDEPRCPPAQQGHRPRSSTATAEPTQFLPSKPRQLSLHNDRHGNNSSCSRRNCGSSTVSSTTAPRNCTTSKPKYRSPCQCTATGESLGFSEKRDHRNLRLRHDGDVDDLDTRTVHHVAQRACQEPVQERHQESRRSAAQFALWVPDSAGITNHCR